MATILEHMNADRFSLRNHKILYKTKLLTRNADNDSVS
jgi:hypothetical protein